jgi:hypothetical protein
MGVTWDDNIEIGVTWDDFTEMGVYMGR